MASDELNNPAKAGVTGDEPLEEVTEKIQKLFPDAKSPAQMDMIARFASATKYRRQLILDGVIKEKGNANKNPQPTRDAPPVKITYRLAADDLAVGPQQKEKAPKNELK